MRELFSIVNGWIEISYRFSFKEVNNFVKFIKNSYKSVFDPKFLTAT